MLQSTCSLLFRPERLVEELKIFHTSIEEGIPMNDIILPIRSSLRKMINIAGTHIPYVSKYALSYICSTWAWNGKNKDDIGTSAIPY
jgi:hypothetical protein